MIDVMTALWMQHLQLTDEELELRDDECEAAGMDYDVCPCCKHQVSMSILRKVPNTNEVVCLPCLHLYHTNLDGSMLEGLVKMLEKEGLYMEGDQRTFGEILRDNFIHRT